MQGAQQKITDDLTKAADPAGKKAGAAAGESMSKALSKKMTGAGTALSKTLTAPIVGVGAASVAAWKEVDAGLDTIVTKTGASGEALDGMRQILKNITGDIPTDFETAGAAIGEVNTRFGVTGEVLETLSSQFIKFAEINGQDVSGSVDSVSKMMAGFGLEAEDASRILDALNTVGQQTGVDVGTLADTVAANAKQFQEMGLTAEEAAAFLGQASMAGLDTSGAMMGLKTAMKKASEDGISLSDALAGFDEVMQSNASESDKLAAAYELFGSKAGAAIENAVSNGTLNLSDFSASLGDFEGSVSDTFEGTLDPMDEFQTTLNDLKSLGAELVESAGPMLVDILGGVTDGVEKLTDAWDGLSPDMQETILKVAGIAAVVGPMLVIGGKVVGGISAISSGLSGLSGMIGGLGSAASEAAPAVTTAGASFGEMAGGALKMIAAAGALLITAAAVWVLADAAIRISEAGTPAIAVLAGMAVGIGVLMGVAALCGPALTAGAVGFIAFGTAMLEIGAGVAIASAGIALVTVAVSDLVQTVSDNSEQINSVVTNVGETVDGTITTISDGITSVIDAISGGVEGVLGAVAGIFDSMGEAALNAGTGFEKLAGAVIDLTQNTGVLDLAATMGATADGVSKITKAADGAGDAAGKIKTMTSAFSGVNTAAQTATRSISTFGTNTKSTMSAAASAISGAKLGSSMATAIGDACSEAQNGLNRLESMFDSVYLSFEQHIAVPHFSLNGSFNAQTGSTPWVSTSWYDKATDVPYLFKNATIFGAGEKHDEMLYGRENLLRDIREASGGETNIYMTVNGAESPEMWATRFAREYKLQARTV
jgi:TP901 family phage tail tape measure protein